jgi:hypothetical protein
MKPINLNDTHLLSKIPVGKWITKKVAGIQAAKLNRLARLGLLEKREVMSGVIEYIRQR